MKKIFILLTMAVFTLFAACGSGAEEATEPVTLEEKRAALNEKQATYRNLAQEIETLQAEIEELDPAAVKLPTVTTQKVQRSDFSHYTDVQGSVEAEDLVSISSEIGGRILDLRIREGQSVRRGQLVAKLDLESVEKQIAELETQLQLANDLYERQKRLWDQEIGSEVQYLQAENNKERLEKAIETVKLQLSKSEVYSPVSGVVEMLIVKAGEIAAPGAPIAQVLNTSKVKIVANVPETLIRSVGKGSKVTAQVPAMDWEREVRITEVARTIDKTNRTLKIEANVTGTGLKPNLLATMRIKDRAQNNVVNIPLELVQQEVGGKSYVLIQGKGDKGPVAKKVYVQTGDSYEGEVVIESGLQGGENIIVKGSRSVDDGQAIEVQEEQMATK
ncbi:MAG: efflux RND transporter periplasmic adaptor subunit [Bacteroidota bacterium]